MALKKDHGKTNNSYLRDPETVPRKASDITDDVLAFLSLKTPRRWRENVITVREICRFMNLLAETKGGDAKPIFFSKHAQMFPSSS
jgi:hypothetical protein